MTKKRFIIIGDSNIEFIMQTQLLLPIYDNKKRLNLKACCDLLNELSEENEQLKDALNQRTEQCDKYYKENEEFKKALIELKEIGDYQDGRIKELSDENEQLKKDIEYYKIEQIALFEYIDKKDDLKLELKVEK